MDTKMNDDEFSAWLHRWLWFLVTSLVGASFAGIAALLRDGRHVTASQVCRAAFISCVVGGIFLAALWDSLAATRPGWLIAVVLCSGAGGGNMLDAVARVLRRALLKWSDTNDNSKP